MTTINMALKSFSLSLYWHAQEIIYFYRDRWRDSTQRSQQMTLLYENVRNLVFFHKCLGISPLQFRHNLAHSNFSSLSEDLCQISATVASRRYRQLFWIWNIVTLAYASLACWERQSLMDNWTLTPVQTNELEQTADIRLTAKFLVLFTRFVIHNFFFFFLHFHSHFCSFNTVM